MKNFGYTINNDRQIDFDKADRRIADYVKNHEPSFNICIACGTCTATCSAGNFTEMNLRKLMIQIKRGDLIAIRTEIAKCMLCGKCFLACPRGVNTRNIIIKINQALNIYETE
ncbi:MAG: 4Fe-4S dicluster domain-containing protein [Bacteroidales bacterium]